MKNVEKKKDELTPLNEKLYNEFSLEKLEERLETDPLMIGDLMGNDDSSIEPACFIYACKTNSCFEQNN